MCFQRRKRCLPHLLQGLRPQGRKVSLLRLQQRQALRLRLRRVGLGQPGVSLLLEGMGLQLKEELCCCLRPLPDRLVQRRLRFLLLRLRPRFGPMHILPLQQRAPLRPRLRHLGLEQPGLPEVFTQMVLQLEEDLRSRRRQLQYLR